jgi:hypothetical protein
MSRAGEFWDRIVGLFQVGSDTRLPANDWQTRSNGTQKIERRLAVAPIFPLQGTSSAELGCTPRIESL